MRLLLWLTVALVLSGCAQEPQTAQISVYRAGIEYRFIVRLPSSVLVSEHDRMVYVSQRQLELAAQIDGMLATAEGRQALHRMALAVPRDDLRGLFQLPRQDTTRRPPDGR